MLFYRPTAPSSPSTLCPHGTVVRGHREQIGSCWRKPNPEQLALLVLVYLQLSTMTMCPAAPCSCLPAHLLLDGWCFRSRHPTSVRPGLHPTFNANLYTLDVLISTPVLGPAND
jgi:hypothetical protein